MADYVIYTDTACDIDPQMLDAQGVKYVSMYFSFIGEDKLYANNDMDITEFYRRMRAGGMAKSAAANPQDYKAAFEEALAQGKDVLYIGLSGALSSSFGSAVAAAKELQAQYPARTIITVDTLSASAGEGMLVNLAVEKKNAGASIEETAAYIEGIRKHVTHWFVVDDLDYLKRGGRVSPTVAFAGKLMNIKPILHVTEDGVPINIAKVRGSKAALRYFLDKFATRQMDEGPIYISHADNMEAVETLKAELKARFSRDVDLVTHIGTVLGAHTGPGALAFYFWDQKR
ncbi:MAG: DegV family protein [Clostridia bacterium]|nr:DegV family protein [Clostridia bacterium]MBR6667595.1 DegV family protein [Clostridia bacterium]